jgi:hypothetical protein
MADRVWIFLTKIPLMIHPEKDDKFNENEDYEDH